MNNPPSPMDTVVARIGDKTIMYREIASDLAGVPEAMRTKSREEREKWCLDAEQRELQERIADAVLPVLMEREHLEVTAGEIDTWLDRLKMDHDHFVRTVEERRRLPLAALAIAEGRQPPAGFSAEALAEAQRLYPTAQAAQRRLDALTAESMREVVVRTIRRKVIDEKLREILKRRAAQENVPFSTFVERYWQRFMTEVGVEVVDPRYHLP